MKPFKHLGAAFGLAISIVLLSTHSLPARALIEYSDGQRSTMVELIEQLEDRHYAKLEYNDDFSSQHLDAYVESLDGSKMFFLASDLEEFEQFRSVMDEQLPKGNLDAGFFILFEAKTKKAEH